MFELAIIILIIVVILLFKAPSNQGMNSANQILDSKLDRLIAREGHNAGAVQLEKALQEIRSDLAKIKGDLDRGLSRLDEIKELVWR